MAKSLQFHTKNTLPANLSFKAYRWFCTKSLRRQEVNREKKQKGSIKWKMPAAG